MAFIGWAACLQNLMCSDLVRIDFESASSDELSMWDYPLDIRDNIRILNGVGDDVKNSWLKLEPSLTPGSHQDGFLSRSWTIYGFQSLRVGFDTHWLRRFPSPIGPVNHGLSGIRIKIDNEAGKFHVDIPASELETDRVSMELPVEFIKIQEHSPAQITLEVHHDLSYLSAGNELLLDNIIISGDSENAIRFLAPRVIVESPTRYDFFLGTSQNIEGNQRVQLLKNNQLADENDLPTELDGGIINLGLPDNQEFNIRDVSQYKFRIIPAGIETPSFTMDLLDNERTGFYADPIPFYNLGGLVSFSIFLPEPLSGETVYEISSTVPDLIPWSPTVTIRRGFNRASIYFSSLYSADQPPEKIVYVIIQRGLEKVNVPIRLINRGVRDLTLTGIQEITEGGKSAHFNLNRNRKINQSESFHFTNIPPGLSSDMETLDFAAGQTQVGFTLTYEDDEVSNPDQTIELTVQSNLGDQTSARLLMIDNDMVAHEFMTGFDQFISDRQTVVSLRALNRSGRLTTQATNIVKIAIVDNSGKEIRTLANDITLKNGQADIPITFQKSDEGHSIQIVGDRQVTTTMNVPPLIKPLDIQIHSFIKDPVRPVIYITENGLYPESKPGRISAIDPETMEVIREFNLGAPASNLVITDQGEFIYTIIPSTGRLAKIDLNANSVSFIDTNTIKTEPGIQRNPFDIAAMKGDPTRLATAAGDRDPRSPRQVVMMRNNTFTSSSPERINQLFSSYDKNFFYVTDHDGFLYRMFSEVNRISLDYQGLQPVSEAYSFVDTGKFVIVRNRGKILDRDELKVIHTFHIPPSWVSTPLSPEPEAYFTAQGKTLTALNPHTFIEYSSINLGMNGTISAFEQWDSNRFLVTNQGGDLVLTNPIPEFQLNAGQDLKSTILSHESVQTGDVYSVRFKVSLQNLSNENAANAQLKISSSKNILPGYLYSDGMVSRLDVLQDGIVPIGDIPGLTSKVVELEYFIQNFGATQFSTVVYNKTLDGKPDDNSSIYSFVAEKTYRINEVVSLSGSVSDLHIPESGARVFLASADETQTFSGVLDIELGPGKFNNYVPGYWRISEFLPLDGGRAFVCTDMTSKNLFILDSESGFEFLSRSDRPIYSLVRSRLNSPSAFFVRNDSSLNFYMDSKSLPTVLPEPSGWVTYIWQNDGDDTFNILESNPPVVRKFRLVDGNFHEDSNFTALPLPGDTITGKVEIFEQKIYTEDGLIFDLQTGEALGGFAIQPLLSSQFRGKTGMYLDRESRRIIFSELNRVHSFHTDTKKHLRTLDLPLTGSINKLGKAGDNLLIFKNSQSEGYLVQTDLFQDMDDHVDLIVRGGNTHSVFKPFARIEGELYGADIALLKVNGHTVSPGDSPHTWSINIYGLTPGENTVTLTVNDTGNPEWNTRRTIIINYQVPGPDSFNDADGNLIDDFWQMSYFGNQTLLGMQDTGRDIDGDGLDLMTEFLFGTNPVIFDRVRSSVSVVNRDGSNLVELEFLHAGRPGISPALDISHDLINWNRTVPEILFDIQSQVLPDGYTASRFRLNIDDGSESAHLFLRPVLERTE